MRFQLVETKVVDSLPADMGDEDDRFGHGFLLAKDEAEERPTSAFAKPVVLMFGRREDGCDVLCRVSGFLPFLDFACTHHIEDVKRRLCGALFKCVRGCHSDWFDDSTKTMQRMPPMKKLFGWYPSKADVNEVQRFQILRVFFPSTRARSIAMRMQFGPGFELVDSKVSPERQFTDVHDLTESGWVEVLHPRVPTRVISHCGAEICAFKNDLRAVEYDNVAPLLVCSFDIECSSSTGGFPQSATDAVVVVGMNFWSLGASPTDAVVDRHVLCLDSCDPVEGSSMRSFEFEYELLDAMRDVIVQKSPDIMLGYNIFGFDWRFLCDRAKENRCQRFFFMSKLIFDECTHGERNLSSGALGDNVMYVLERSGAVAHDLFMSIKAEHKLPSYKLDAVSEHFIGDHKEDMPISTLFAAWKPGGTAADRAAVARYCSKDCDLPLVLVDRLKTYISLVEMSRVTHTQMRDLVMRGQQIKVYQQVLHFAHRMGYVMNEPCVPPPTGDFQGATVVDPKAGFYEDAVAVLDFMSLYPSIMRWKNLCYCTYVVNEEDARREGARVDRYEFENADGGRYGYAFARNVPGVLPEVLRHLLDERKKTKKRMKVAESEQERDILDKRQLAIKVSCNSVYGFTGVTEGMYPLRAIAESVTKVGRGLIDDTIRLCEERERVQVVYGDTDSVMIRFVPALGSLAEVFERAGALADGITDSFANGGERIIVLEFEKVMQPFLLLERKRYACMAYETLGKKPKRDVKGLPTVRRDNTPIARLVLEDVLSGLLEHGAISKAEDFLAQHLNTLRRNEFSFSDYIQSRSLKATYKAASSLAQCRTVEKMRLRNPGSEPRPGDRVEFVIVEGRNPKIAERAEDPAYVRSAGLKVDRLYILENQIENIITKVFGRVGGTRHVQLMNECRYDLQNQQSGQSLVMAFMKGAYTPPAKPPPTPSSTAAAPSPPPPPPSSSTTAPPAPTAPAVRPAAKLVPLTSLQSPPSPVKKKATKRAAATEPAHRRNLQIPPSFLARQG